MSETQQQLIANADDLEMGVNPSPYPPPTSPARELASPPIVRWEPPKTTPLVVYDDIYEMPPRSAIIRDEPLFAPLNKPIAKSQSTVIIICSILAAVIVVIIVAVSVSVSCSKKSKYTSVRGSRWQDSSIFGDGVNGMSNNISGYTATDSTWQQSNIFGDATIPTDPLAIKSAYQGNSIFDSNALPVTPAHLTNAYQASDTKTYIEAKLNLYKGLAEKMGKLDTLTNYKEKDLISIFSPEDLTFMKTYGILYGPNEEGIFTVENIDDAAHKINFTIIALQKKLDSLNSTAPVSGLKESTINSITNSAFMQDFLGKSSQIQFPIDKTVLVQAFGSDAVEDLIKNNTIIEAKTYPRKDIEMIVAAIGKDKAVSDAIQSITSNATDIVVDTMNECPLCHKKSPKPMCPTCGTDKMAVAKDMAEAATNQVITVGESPSKEPDLSGIVVIPSSTPTDGIVTVSKYGCSSCGLKQPSKYAGSGLYLSQRLAGATKIK